MVGEAITSSNRSRESAGVMSFGCLGTAAAVRPAFGCMATSLSASGRTTTPATTDAEDLRSTDVEINGPFLATFPAYRFPRSDFRGWRCLTRESWRASST